MNNLIHKKTAFCLISAGLMLSGCELLGPKLATKYQLTPVSDEPVSEKPAVLFEELQNKKTSDEELKSKIELYPASSRFSPKRAGQGGQPKVKTAGPGTYSLNFDEADLGEVSKVILSDILGQNYVLSPKVAGKVTLQTTEPLTKEELLPTLEMVLRMNNAALIKDGRIYHIEPAADAVYSSGVGTGPSSDRAGFQSRVIPIRYVAAADLVEVIKPLVQEKTIVNVDPMKNALVVSGTEAEMERINDLVATFDIDVLRGRSFGLFTLAHVAPEDMIKELEAIFDLKNDEGKGGGQFFRFLPIERLNAVLAITQQQSYLADIENWVLRLDRASTASGGGVNVYRVQHMDATELADILNSIFTGAAMPSQSAKVASGQTAATITNKQATEARDTSKKTSGSQQTGDASVANVSEHVKIIADVVNNSIIIVASPQEYDVIHKVIAQLDAMPLQVLVDATIVAVTLNDDLKYGIQWYIEHGYAGGRAAATSGTAGVSMTKLAAAAATGGFGYAFISGSDDIKAILYAESQKNNLNVISSPSVMVLNNQEAYIQVGDEIPLRTSQSTNVTNVTSTTPIIGDNTTQSSGGLVTSGIQQRKTGVKLKVKPRVNANGMVIMTVEQSVERATKTDTSDIDSPTIQTREITSNVAVLSGETIVLGGLIDKSNTFSKTGIPFLHDLPLVGSLFGSTIRNEDRTELVVLITPRVLQTKQDARMIANEFKRKLSGIYEEAPTHSPGPWTNSAEKGGWAYR
ncbi:MAG: type II secretion system secretin GspD [Methylococcaceae bacterium]|nr:type II secretion system secretin GspD [Methylococcaceae bacterium]